MRKIPLVKFLLLFVISISLTIYFEIKSIKFIYGFFISLFTLGICEIGISNSKKFKQILSEIIIVVVVLFAGFSIAIIQTDQSKSIFIGHIINKNQNLLSSAKVEVVAPIKVNSKTITLTAEVSSITLDSINFITSGKSLFYLKKDSSSLQILPGDLLQLYNLSLDTVAFYNNPGQFDYSKYLRFNQIHYLSFIKKWDNQGLVFNLKRYPTILRNKALSLFKSNISDKEHLAVINALVLGYKDELSNSTKLSFSSTGAMHVLAVSGLHVGIIFYILHGVFGLFTFYQRNQTLRNVLVLAGIWLYAMITGMSPSVIRATTMLTFFIVAKIMNRQTNIFNVLAASAILLLVFDPFLIMKVGFQLSYLAVLGILFLQPKIEKLISPKSWILKKIWTISCVSIAAQITTFPLGLLYFHQFPNYFLMSNLTVIPAAFIILILGILILVFSFSSWVLTVLVFLMKYILSSLLYVVHFIEEIPGALSQGYSISIFETFLIYAFLLSFIICVKYNRQWLYVLCISLFICFLAIDMKEDLNLKKLNRLVIYNVPNHFGMDLINGSNHYFIGDSVLINDSDKLLFYVKHNWFDLDLNDPKFIAVDTLKQKQLSWNGKKINLFHNFLNIQADVTVLKKLTKTPQLNLTQIDSTYLVVLDDYSEKFKNMSSKYHFVKNKGAFVLDF